MKNVVVYTKHNPHCPWCVKAVQLLDQHKIPFVERAHDHPDFPAGAITVPQIVADGVLIGGYTELAACLG